MNGIEREAGISPREMRKTISGKVETNEISNYNVVGIVPEHKEINNGKLVLHELFDVVESTEKE